MPHYINTEWGEKLNKGIEKMVKEHNILVEGLTERQLAEAIKQMILAGDFQRLVTKEGGQIIVYLPYAFENRLKDEIKRLQYLLEANGIDYKTGEPLE